MRICLGVDLGLVDLPSRYNKHLSLWAAVESIPFQFPRRLLVLSGALKTNPGLQLVRH